MTVLNDFFSEVSADVDAKLNELIARGTRNSRSLEEAIRWSLFAGGKRFRPALMIASGEAFDAARADLQQTAAAVEMLHTYSLIHDDLPSMDDDDLRRGRETCHRKFGESTAILAGDALQAMAFHAIASDERLEGGIRLSLLEMLGDAAEKMVTGQQLDLEAEGKSLSLDNVRTIHANKTGALIAFSAAAGALIGGAEEEEMKAVERFGSYLGLLFQITDDLLDVTASTASLGKTAGKDMSAKKATYPNVAGLAATRQLAEQQASNAVDALSAVNFRTERLKLIVEYLLERSS